MPLASPGANNQPLLDLVNLTPLMELSSGRAETTIALIDGPVVTDHEDLSSTNIREIPGQLRGTCARANSIACMHGTFVAGILSARRRLSMHPQLLPAALCSSGQFSRRLSQEIAICQPQLRTELATAIIDCVDAGANVINLSAAIVQSSAKGERQLEEALDYSTKRGL